MLISILFSSVIMSFLFFIFFMGRLYELYLFHKEEKKKKKEFMNPNELKDYLTNYQTDSAKNLTKYLGQFLKHPKNNEYILNCLNDKGYFNIRVPVMNHITESVLDKTIDEFDSMGWNIIYLGLCKDDMNNKDCYLLKWYPKQ